MTSGGSLLNNTAKSLAGKHDLREEKLDPRIFTSEVVLNLLVCLVTAIIGWLVFIFYFILERRERLKNRMGRRNSSSGLTSETISETFEM